MKPETIPILSIFLIFGLLEFFRTALFNKKGQTRQDGWVEIISSIFLMTITQPLVLFTAAFVVGQLAPGLENRLAGINVFLGFLLFLIFDDMMQYWWHRASHTFPWLYKLHRPHHNAEYMSIRLVYRNNIFYYFLMPSLWFSGTLIYLGLGHIYIVFISLKMLIIIGAHSDVAWDAPLYRIKWLSPVMWVVERTISTPATHHAHHGKHKADGVTNYKGNYGNMLFFWDVLFGTAKITRQYPPQYGVENLPPTTLGEQMLWPLVSTGHSTEVAAETKEAQS